MLQRYVWKTTSTCAASVAMHAVACIWLSFLLQQHLLMSTCMRLHTGGKTWLYGLLFSCECTQELCDHDSSADANSFYSSLCGGMRAYQHLRTVYHPFAQQLAAASHPDMVRQSSITLLHTSS
jgi:hypothetical protein